jgi:ABC-type lipoprotein export system ATPase subunit
MPLIQIKNVSKSYTDPGSGASVPVLRGVSLEVQPGESVAVVGPSGCGKSTLLNILGTLDEPDEGEVLFEGQSLRGCGAGQLSALRSQKIGFIFQLHHLMPQCTVLENVLLPSLALRKTGASSGGHRARAEALLRSVGLADRAAWKPAQLSGGERQRVAVVRALINEPRLVLADEPTGALDEKNADSLTALLLDLQHQTGTSLVMVTHHPAQAAKMGRVLRIHEGRIE